MIFVKNTIHSFGIKKMGYRPTDRRTDGGTDRPTDTPSYRDGRTHLKKTKGLISWLKLDLSVAMKLVRDYLIWSASLFWVTFLSVFLSVNTSVYLRGLSVFRRSDLSVTLSVSPFVWVTCQYIWLSVSPFARMTCLSYCLSVSPSVWVTCTYVRFFVGLSDPSVCRNLSSFIVYITLFRFVA